MPKTPLKPTWLHALIQLRQRSVPSSQALANVLHVSQQTAGRWLIEFKKQNWVEKKPTYQLTAHGRAYLHSLLTPQRFLTGAVFSGVGEGKYYLSKSGYEKQFPSLLGFRPFPGTLNLRLTGPECLQASHGLRQYDGLRLEGFKEKDRTFGPARCYPCRIYANGKTATGAIIVPERTHYPEDVVEILSPTFLRKALKLKDGDGIKLELE